MFLPTLLGSSLVDACSLSLSKNAFEAQEVSPNLVL